MRSDNCTIPVEVTNLDVSLGGTMQVASGEPIECCSNRR